MSKHIAIYTRVSTRAQDTASQEKDLKAWTKNAEESVEWYSDEATGKTMDRPGMNRLLDDLHAGKIAKVVVWRLDRLGRTAKGLTALFEDITANKATLVSLRDGIDLATPAGRLMANVLASVAAYETEVRNERVRAGQAIARAKGIRWGGSKKGREVKGRVSEEQIQVINQMKGSAKITAIARATGLSRQTIYNYLKSTAGLIVLYALLNY